MTQSYRDLLVWQKALNLVTKIYQNTQKFPKEEIYGLTSQIRRAAVSIPSNIAEGKGRNSKGEFSQFLGHARGSLYELETQVLIAQNLNYLNENEANELLKLSGELGRMLNGLKTSLK
jgi:four helix bundle protein